MMTKRLLALLSLALVAAPMADAQQFDGVTVFGTDEALMIPAAGSTTLPFSVTLGCGEFLGQQAQSLQATLTTDLPAYYGATSTPVTFDAGADCLNQDASVTKSVDLVLNPVPGAEGRAPMPFTVTATVGSTSSEPFSHTKNIQIDYVPGHTLTPSVSFPYELTDADAGVLEFDLEIAVQANTDTMVMFQQVSSNGTLSGIGHQVFGLSTGDAPNRTLHVTYKAPEYAWDTDTISFYNYSHCLKGSPCDEQLAQTIEWTIVNKASSGGSGGDGDSKDSPGLGAGLLVGIVAVAFLARRRS